VQSRKFPVVGGGRDELTSVAVMLRATCWLNRKFLTECLYILHATSS